MKLIIYHVKHIKHTNSVCRQSESENLKAINRHI